MNPAQPTPSAHAEVRIGIIGAGVMGLAHAKNILSGNIPRLRLTALCKGKRAPGPMDGVKFYDDSHALIRSGELDAVLIATPHFSHTAIGIDALQAGLHVLVEKPISVHKRDAECFLAAHRDPCQVFAVMFNQRTDPFYQRIRTMVRDGELGEIRRMQWTITNWFRTAAYYSGSPWRATWAGEGGGVLLNQAPHNLDLLQWIFGMPASIRAFCRLGQYHDIETEDDVTAYLQFPNGATGVFITSTGESPGTNRLEIAGERGKLIYENDRLTFTQNEVATSAFSKTAESGFASPATTEVQIPISGHGDQHTGILKNFTAAILDGKPLIAPAADGLLSVELSNAMLYSTFTNQTIKLPLDSAAYEQSLNKLIASSSRTRK